MRKVVLGLTVVLAMIGAGFAQTDTYPTSESVGVQVQRTRPFVEDLTVRPRNVVTMVARHADGTEFFRKVVHNLRTNAGSDAQSSQMANTSTQAAACNYIALTNDGTAPNVADTTLASEISSNGLSRAQGAYAHTSSTSAFTVTKTFTATGTQSAQKAGLFNASSVGTLCFETAFTPVSLVSTDTLQITWTVNF